MEIISKQDTQILRNLANHQLELAHEQKNLERIQQWMEHHTSKASKPIVTVEMHTFAQEIFPKRLQCSSQLARNIETELYKNFLNYEILDDDWVVKDYFGIGYARFFTPFGLDVQTQTTDGLGHQFIHQIHDLECDFEKLGKSQFGFDKNASNKRKILLENIFGDILPVKFEGSCLSACLTQDIVHIMGMENMFLAMHDEPEKLQQMLDMLASDYIEYFKALEKENILLPTTRFEFTAQGSMAFTDDIKSTGHIGTQDIWGFMDSQETTGVNPDMYKELIFPAYKKVAKEFGLFSYGCCESTAPIWTNCLSTLKNLRKLSISPWCDEEFMGEQLRGTNISYQRKPNPNYLGVDVNLDEDAFRAHILKTVHAAQGCKLEFTQRDVYTIHHNEKKAKHFVQIIREVIDEFYN